MCGICGFVDFKSVSGKAELMKMTSTLKHRGPDDAGGDVFNLPNFTLALGHTRLSILDLSAAGHQPMKYKQLSIVLNGEIYNFQEIKKELRAQGHIFNSESDTEVVLHAFDEWGEKCVSKFIGMFAFVIYNQESRELVLFRDRAGVKPLYYYWDGQLLLFGSELKSFHKHPGFVKQINVQAVHQYMDFGYVPAPNCIFENCKKLNPGHILTLKLDTKDIQIDKYWDVKDYYNLPRLEISYTEAKTQLEKLLHSAFEYRMVADVPVGVFLSGGYDSTAVASILQSTRSNSKIKTFTIGFEQGNNEAPFAKEIAKYIGTDHTEYYCTTKEAQEIIPTLPYFYDEPFADSSAIPTILVSRLARQSVTVSLSADGGDEIFAGYSIYKSYLDRLAQLNKIPGALRPVAGYVSGLTSAVLPVSMLNLKHKFDVIARIFRDNHNDISEKIFKEYFLLSRFVRNSLYVDPYHYQPSAYDGDFGGFRDTLSKALAIDYQMYMQNDILTKVDRATMSVSLEGREPFLDQRIIEFAAQLPSEYKYGSTQKMILRDIVHNYIPKSMMDRPKSGFSIPLSEWLKTDLISLIEDNFRIENIKESGFFQVPYMQNLKDLFLANKLKDETIIWKLIQFQMWYKQWM